MIVPADEVPPEATVDRTIQDGKYVNVSVPYPTLSSINQVVDWSSESGFDGVIAHDIFDQGSDIGEKYRSTTYVANDSDQIWVVDIDSSSYHD